MKTGDGLWTNTIVMETAKSVAFILFWLFWLFWTGQVFAYGSRIAS